MLMLSTLFTNPLLFIVWAVALVLTIAIHEYAHARAADTLGDPTPRAQGRLTLDPRAHLDPLGTIMLVFLGFGWGRPVEFDPYNLRMPRRDGALIALAGPVSNLLFALVLPLIIRVLPPGFYFLTSVFSILISLNIGLAIFNLVPVFPLDGEKILLGLLPRHLADEYQAIMRQYGTIILVMLLLPIAGGSSPISLLISPTISWLSRLLL
jgi:Zn-dependent protease